MTFTSDVKARRTYDPERRLELFSTTSGPDGRMGFRLVSPDGESAFNTFIKVRDASPLERAARPHVDKTVVYEIYNAPRLPNFSFRKTYELIGEALLAHRCSERDDEVNWAVTFPVGIPE